MDRRSWLWRRKSSEKSPGETESSGSISSHSERFYDDQVYSSHHTQSPEVTSKAVPIDEEEINDSVKALTEKLSAALLHISAKEDLVKQHSKVAEEAVSGWEKAEKEVSSLKQQLDAFTHKNSALEDRVGHLDGALKECLRQLRHVREEHDRKIHECESTKSELENQLVKLQSQLQTAKSEPPTSIDTDDLHIQLEAMKKENLTLKLELDSRLEELELRTIERDLSTQAAETASKQHLDSIKKVAKLEAECRWLKAMAHKATTSSVYVESVTDCQSERGLEPSECEPSQYASWASSALTTKLDHRFKNEKGVGRNLMLVPSVELNLMDDFLEMERLAALPESESGSQALSDQTHVGGVNLQAELEAMANRTVELEEKLERMETEKIKLEMALSERQDQLKLSGDRLREAEAKLLGLQNQLAMAHESGRTADIELESTKRRMVELQNQLAMAHESKRTAEVELESTKRMVLDLQTQLDLANETRGVAEGEFEATHLKKHAAELRLVVVEAELKDLLWRIDCLEEEVKKERASSNEAVDKCRKLEDEISKMQYKAEARKAASSNQELKIKQEKELEVAASKFAECQKTIASLGQQLRSLATLEDFLID
ncbi:hypothetical protein LguiA_013407 [Lonicera macranthoides]